MAISSATELIEKRLDGHNKRVAYIAYRLAAQLEMAFDDLIDVIISGLIHDVGIIGIKNTASLFELDKEDILHAEVGYRLLRTIPELSTIALIVRGHHGEYQRVAEREPRREVFLSQLLSLADRVDVLLDYESDPLSQIDGVLEALDRRKGTRFHPEIVEAFAELAKVEAFWFDLFTMNFVDRLVSIANERSLYLDDDGLLRFGRFFSHVIDFRSHFTSTHSSGVAAIAVFLAEKSGFRGRELTLMKIAGYLHDVGKLAVPNYILEKDGYLTKDELNVIKSHTYYTKVILEKIRGFEEVALWAALHHQKLDGSGYPFHLKGEEIPLGARIITVADIFTALNEDRPYRKGVSENETAMILTEMAQKGWIDAAIVNLAISHYSEIRDLCLREQKLAGEKYRDFWGVSTKTGMVHLQSE